MRCRLVCALSALVAAVAVLPTLAPLAYAPLPLGRVRPQGWLMRELQIQGSGLSGGFSSMWEPFYNSPWLGGNSSYQNWAALFPYVVHGFVGQAVLLNDTAQLLLVRGWLDYVVTHATATGWLGPDASPKDGMLYWPRLPLLIALFQLHEAEGSDGRLITAAIAWLRDASARLSALPMGYDWSGVRAQEFIFVCQYLIESPATPPSDLPFLWDFTMRLYSLGIGIVDYERDWFVEGAFPTGAVLEPDCNLTNHGVNQAMVGEGGGTGGIVGVCSVLVQGMGW